MCTIVSTARIILKLPSNFFGKTYNENNLRSSNKNDMVKNDYLVCNIVTPIQSFIRYFV